MQEYWEPSGKEDSDSSSVRTHLDDRNERFESLSSSVMSSYRDLAPFRELYRNLVKEYAGPLYGQKGTEVKYLNKLQQTVDAYMIMLAANRPKVMVSSDHSSLGGFATHFQVAVNNMMKEIRIEETIRDWVLDAYFCIGIVKTHLADSGYIELEDNVTMDPGTPFASVVSLDDWVFDKSARRLDEAKYIADMYEVPYHSIAEGVEDGMYDEKVAEKIRFDKTNDDQGRVDSLAHGQEPQQDEFDPLVTLCDVWIPGDNTIYTFHVTDRSKFKMSPHVLSEMEWDGPEHGPYHTLSFNSVPHSVMPTSPASHQLFLDQLINNLLRKSAGQAQRQKDNPVYQPGEGSETMERLVKARDGQPIASNDPSSVTVIKQGGVDASNMAFLSNLVGMYDTYAGNLTAMLGLGAQSDTVGQEQLIHSAGSKRGAQMQFRVLEATQRVISALGSMLWDDEFKYIAGTISYPGTGAKNRQSDWEPGDREGNFLDYNFDINVHSMSYQPPAKRAEAILMLLSQVYFPGMQMMMQEEGPIDFAELTDILADLLNLPRLRNILRPMLESHVSPRPGPQDGSDSNSSKPANTTRNYVRRSVPTGGTPENRGHMEQQAWLGRAMSKQQNNVMSHTPAG